MNQLFITMAFNEVLHLIPRPLLSTLMIFASYMQVNNALAIRLSVPSTSNQGFPAFDSGDDGPSSPRTGQFKQSLRNQLLRYARKFEDHDPTLPRERDFDLRDRNKACDDTESVDLTLHLSHRHNLQRITNNPAAATLYFQVAFDAIVSTLFAVRASDGKSEQLPIHLDERRGIFGRLTNFDANLEADQKGMPCYCQTPCS